MYTTFAIAALTASVFANPVKLDERTSNVCQQVSRLVGIRCLLSPREDHRFRPRALPVVTISTDSISCRTTSSCHTPTIRQLCRSALRNSQSRQQPLRSRSPRLEGSTNVVQPELLQRRVPLRESDLGVRDKVATDCDLVQTTTTKATTTTSKAGLLSYIVCFACTRN